MTVGAELGVVGLGMFIGIEEAVLWLVVAVCVYRFGLKLLYELFCIEAPAAFFTSLFVLLV